MPDKKKEVAYVAKSVGTNLTERHNNAKEMLGEDAKYGNKGGIGESKMTVNTAYNSMLPEFEVTAPSKMYDSPAKVAKPKKEVVYQADAGKSDYSDNYGTQTSYKKTKKDASGKVKSTASADLTTGKGNVLPEFELAVTKMHGSPAKMSTVDPTTGQVLPQDLGTGPVNVANANTAQTLQKQADAEAVKQNRAGAPDRSAGAVSQSPMTMKDNFKNSSMAHAARMFGNVSNPVPSPSQFNEGLRKASAQGKLDGNPSFKSKVDAAPIKAIPIGAVIKGVQAIGALKSAAKAKGEPEIKGTILPELDVEYDPSGSGKSYNASTGGERDSTAAEMAEQKKENQSKGDGNVNTSYKDPKTGKKIKLGSSLHASF